MKIKVMHTYAVLFLWGTVFTLLVENVQAQACCTTGSMSLGGIERTVSKEGILNLGFGYQNIHLGQTYQGTERVSDLLERTADVQFLKAEIEYGLADRVSLFLNLSYISRSRELTGRDALTKAPERITFEGSGLGDPIVLLKYQIATPTFFDPFGMTVGSGAKLPVGNYRLKREGTRLPIDLQPSNGAVELLSWFFAQYKFPELSFGFHMHAMYRYASINFDGYRFGDEITTSLGASYSLLEYLGAAVTFRGRFASPDYSNRRILDGTGGSSWYVEPQVLYFEGNSTFRLFVQMPVYQNVRGNQLTTSYILGLELVHELNLLSRLQSLTSSEEKNE